ncbi:MAG: RDD family protein [Opitutaceae bacterium]
MENEDEKAESHQASEPAETDKSLDSIDPSDQVVPQPVEDVDSLDELAFAVTEAMPQEGPAYRRVDPVARLGANLFDGLLFISVALILTLTFFGLRLETVIPPLLSLSADKFGHLSVAGFAFLWLLYTTTEVFFAGTPGKTLIGIRIATTRFAPSTRRQRLIRWTLRRSGDIAWVMAAMLMIGIEDRFVPKGLQVVLPSIGFATWVALLWVVISFGFTFGPKKLALHDRISGTAVIRDIDAQPSKERAFGVIAATTREERRT